MKEKILWTCNETPLIEVDFYKINIICNNCHKENTYHLRKGMKVQTFRLKCAYCECDPFKYDITGFPTNI